ncbi:MAG TPA: hypothetical protein PK252_08285 [Bacteroidales bacterium]|mgnify:CR=1 FL=1|nr:hypothetical protein [Bacteroidales bacterium]
MRTNLLFKLAVALFCVSCLVGCEDNTKDAEAGPTLTVSGSNISGNSINASAGTSITVKWVAEKGTSDLSTFSIKAGAGFLDSWQDKTIDQVSAAKYVDSLNIQLPQTEGEYLLSFVVTDKKGKTASQSLTVFLTKPPITDVFAYYQNSTFIFVIKDGTSTVKTAKMTWKVTNYNESSKVATISCTLDPATTVTPLNSVFYFRKATSGALEFSNDGVTWRNLTDNSKDINFIFGTKAAKPSSLYGSVNTTISSAYVIYPEGTSSGYLVSSEYNSSNADRYLFTEYTKEYYSDKVGFTQFVTFTSDGSDYPPFTYKREIELVYYKVYQSGGTIIEGGAKKPAAPGNLSGSYARRVESWNSRTGMYELHSFISLSWTDNSDNEIQFNVYIKADDGNYYPLSSITNLVLIPDYFPANTNSGIVRRGYYVDWDAGTYYFKITAKSATEESDFSNEAAVTCY